MNPDASAPSSSVKELTLHYSVPLLRRAVWFYFIRTARGFFDWRYVATLIVMVASLIIGGKETNRWLAGVIIALLLFSVLLPLWMYLAYYRFALRLFRSMRVCDSVLTYTENDITFRSERGSATVPWSSIGAVWQSETFWLLLFSRSQFVTLPLVDLDDETREVILRKTANGKLAN